MPVKKYIEQIDRNRYYFWDDFGASNLDIRTWGYGGSAGGSLVKLAALGGQIRITVGGTSGNEYYLVQNTRRNIEFPADCTYRVQIEDETYSAHQFGFEVDGTHYVEWIANSAVSTNWLVRCQNGASYTEVDTGWRVDPDVWVELRIVATASSVQFLINGSLRTTVTTNIPTGPFGPIVYLYRNAGGVGTRSSLLDWVEIFGSRA